MYIKSSVNVGLYSVPYGPPIDRSLVPAIKRTGLYSHNPLWRKGELRFATSRFKMQYKHDKDFCVHSHKYLPNNMIIFHRELSYRTYEAPNRH
jgi:hypothetical protein